MAGSSISVGKTIPAGIWVLGFVSLLMDVSSEMIHALLPIYLVTILGTSALTVGVIEGIAEATASITKIFSGALSDWLGKRKFLAALGYGLAAFTKPIFPLATSVGWLVAARFIDRVGKGIRGAPRDALVADIAPPELRGASFGLRQSLDTVGAFLGPLLAIVVMWLTLRQLPDRVLGRGHSGLPVVRLDRVRGQGTGAAGRSRAGAIAAQPGRARSASAAPIGGSSRSPPSSPWRASARPS